MVKDFQFQDRSTAKIDRTGWTYDTIPLGKCQHKHNGKKCGHSVEPRFSGAFIGDCVYCGQPHKFNQESRQWEVYDYAPPVKPYLEDVTIDARDAALLHPILMGTTYEREPNKLMMKGDIA
jgi:hypothetical protein